MQQVKGTTKKSDLDALVSSLREELGQLRVAKVRHSFDACFVHYYCLVVAADFLGIFAPA